MTINSLKYKLFRLKSDQEFNELSLEIFRYQYLNNEIYRAYADAVDHRLEVVKQVSDIPFLPIEFYKNHVVVCGKAKSYEMIFESSGTTGMEVSRHYVRDLELYKDSFMKGFELFYGHPDKYLILALLPSYLERKNSSLVYMVNELIRVSGHSRGGFYLEGGESLIKAIEKADRTVLLIGVTFALLDLATTQQIHNPDLIIMETGGMKGRRKEMIREEVHQALSKAFGQKTIHSEYGMTELLSQAYSKGDGGFQTPPWMKVMVRDPNDPLTLIGHNKTGGINVMDLANLHTCSFIATQDLGRTYPDGRFEVLGRFDTSDIRGCNLLVTG